jgi:hypothetical protein
VTGKSNTPLMVNCPSGELALSGGWTSSVRNIPITFSKRSGNGWQVLINTLNVGLIPTTAAYVVCLQHVAGAAVTERQYTIHMNPGAFEIATAQCNPGETDLGGGVENAGLTIRYLAPLKAPPLGFAAQVRNDTGSVLSFTTYAECLQATGATRVSSSSSQAAVNPGASAGVQASCPAGALIVGGGEVTNITSMLYDYSPSNSSTWQAHIVNQDTVTGMLTVFPWCLSFS